MTTKLKISGMHCNACKVLIEDVAKDTSGVTDCAVDLAGGTAVIEHESSFNPADLIKEVESLGEYKIEIV